MKLKSTVVVCLLSLALCSTQFAQTNGASSTASESEKLGKLLENYFEDFLKFDPNAAATLGDRRYDDQWANNISDEFRTKNRDFYARYLKELSAIDRNRLVGGDRLNYDTLNYAAETAIEGLKFGTFHLTPIYRGDPTTSFAQMASGKSTHPYKTVKNYEDFLGRTRGFQIWVETAIANMRKGMATGIVQPRIVIERRLPEIKTLLTPDIKQSLFYQPINDFPKDFSEADKARLTESYTKAINEIVYPTYRKLYDFLETEYLPKTRQTVGLSAIAGGREQYAFRARMQTTTKLSPDEIHRIGLGEVRRIRGEMETIKKQTGFKGDLKAFFEFLRTDPQFFPFKTADEVLDRYRAIGKQVQPNLTKFFGIFPQAKVEVWRQEKFREVAANEEYRDSRTLDGVRFGIFYVGIPDATRYQTIRMEALYLHEAIPGHHHQRSIQLEQKNVPRFRQIYYSNAYAEGWGLYVESLGAELGLYTDPYSRFGMLAMDMMRSVRLVVDTGMHSKGWTREQAINYFLENAPMTEDDVTAQVERYIVNPGQALAYKIGQLKILELRRRSERALGAKFSLRDFHDEILKDGQIPLDVLETKVNEWIAKKRQNG